jgi:hypothetical protein
MTSRPLRIGMAFCLTRPERRVGARSHPATRQRLAPGRPGPSRRPGREATWVMLIWRFWFDRPGRTSRTAGGGTAVDAMGASRDPRILGGPGVAREARPGAARQRPGVGREAAPAIP